MDERHKYGGGMQNRVLAAFILLGFVAVLVVVGMSLGDL